MATKKKTKKKNPAKRPAKKKRRTAAQIAATRKLVAMNKKRKNAGKKKARKNAGKPKRAKVSRGSQSRKKPMKRKNNGAIGEITEWTPCTAVKVGRNPDGEMTLYIKPRL